MLNQQISFLGAIDFFKEAKCALFPTDPVCQATTPAPGATAEPTPWYKTTGGMIGIGVGAAVVLYVLFKK